MIFLRVLRAFVVSLFSTKRAASPLYRETQFFCARGTGFQPVKTRPRWPCYFGLLGVLFWTFKFEKFEFV